MVLLGERRTDPKKAGSISFQYICPLSLHLLGTSGKFTPKNSNFNACFFIIAGRTSGNIVNGKLIPSKFDLQTSYALDVFIDKSIAIFLTIQGLW